MPGDKGNNGRRPFVHSYLFRLFISMLALSLAPILVLGTVSYTASVSRLRRQVQQTSIAEVGRAAAAVHEKNVAMLESILGIYSMDESQRFSRQSGEVGGQSLLDAQRLREKLMNYEVSNPLVEDVFVYYRNADRIVSSKRMGQTRTTLTRYYSFSECSYDQWMELFSPGSDLVYWRLGQVVMDPSQYIEKAPGYQGIALVRTLPYSVHGDSAPVAIALLLNGTALAAQIKQSISIEDAVTVLVDSHGQVLADTDGGADALPVADVMARIGSAGGTMELNREKLSVAYAPVESMGGYVITMVPTRVFYTQADGIWTMTLVLCLVLMVLDFALAYFSSRRLYSPVERIAGILTGRREPTAAGDGGEGEMAVIERNVLFTLSEKKRLEEYIDQNLTYLQERFWLNAARRRFGTEDELLRRMRELRMDPWKDGFIINVFRIDNPYRIAREQRDIPFSHLQLSLREIVGRYVPEGMSIRFFSDDEEAVCGILCGDMTESYDEFQKHYRDIQHTVRRELGITVSIGAASPGKELTEIPEAFESALKAVRNCAFSGRSRICIDKGHGDMAMEYINITLGDEEYIFNALSHGDVEQAVRYADGIIDKAVRKTKCGYEQMMEIFRFLVNIGIRAAYEKGVSVQQIYNNDFDLYQEVRCYEDAEEFKSFLKRQYVIILNSIAEIKNGDGILWDEVKQYVEDNYHRDLSIEQLAERFHFSPGYFGKKFAQQHGMSLIRYMNGLRVRKARTIMTGGCCLNKVAESVGFNTYKTFQRVFKSETGLSPEGYRNSLRTAERGR